MTVKKAPAAVTVDQLLKPRLGEGTVDVDGLGRFTIRTLTRAQALEVQTLGQDAGVLEAENLLISYGLVSPALTPEQVAAWSETAPAGELQAISVAIGTISGMRADSGKAAYKSV